LDLKSAGSTRPISRTGEKKMDFNALKNYATALVLLYAWTLFAAVAFSLGEKVCRGFFPQRQPAASGAKAPAKG
jgi:hypothetical protein